VKLRLVAVAALLVVLGPALGRAEDSEWMPLRAGERWVYAVHSDHSYVPERGTIDRVFHTGTTVLTARAADSVVRGAFAVEEKSRLDPIQQGSVEETLTARVLSSSNEVLMHASGSIAKPGDDPATRYQPPLRLLTTVGPGESWRVGNFRQDQTEIEMRGEVIGIGALKDEPGCDACLEVRYRGPISGKIPIYGGDAEILSGSLERVVWYRRGVGAIRDVANVASELKLPDGKLAKTAHTLTMRLVEHTLAP
jgi:hypothetical protein